MMSTNNDHLWILGLWVIFNCFTQYFKFFTENFYNNKNSLSYFKNPL